MTPETDNDLLTRSCILVPPMAEYRVLTYAQQKESGYLSSFYPKVEELGPKSPSAWAYIIDQEAYDAQMWLLFFDEPPRWT